MTDADLKIPTSQSRRDDRRRTVRLDDSYQIHLPFDLVAWVGFLMTQSNITQAIDEEPDGEAARRWLSESLESFFQGEGPHLMTFGGPMWCLQLTESV